MTMEERAWDIASTFAPADQTRAELFDATLAALREAKAEGAREMQERCEHAIASKPIRARAPKEAIAAVVEQCLDAIRSMEPAP